MSMDTKNGNDVSAASTAAEPRSQAAMRGRGTANAASVSQIVATASADCSATTPRLPNSTMKGKIVRP